MSKKRNVILKARQLGKSTMVNPFSKSMFPNMKRVFSKLIAQDIINVQPMTSPSSTLFNMGDDITPPEPAPIKPKANIYKELDKILRNKIDE